MTQYKVWQSNRQVDTGGDQGTPRLLKSIVSPGYIIATALVNQKDDADLFAAAPDLLAALQEIAHHSESADHRSWAYDKTKLEYIAQRARAAIAKAQEPQP